MDARAGVQFLHDNGFDDHHIVYVGESIGTGVAAQLAASELSVAVLLRSPFASLVDEAKTLYPWLPVNLLLRDRFETMQYLPSITCPITVLAGSADSTVSVGQSTTVANNAPNLFQFIVVPGVDHNDGIWFGSYLAQQVDALARFAVPQ